MSDTPLTDAESLVNDGTGVKQAPYVSTKFAKALECENQQLRDGLKVCKEVIDKQPHSVYCSMSADYPFGDKARQAWKRRSCNCWKHEALSHPAVQGLKN